MKPNTLRTMSTLQRATLRPQAGTPNAPIDSNDTLMNTTLKSMLVITTLLLLVPRLPAQFNSGSDGSDGALNITNNTTLALPPDGIFRFTTIDIAQGVTLSFTRNALNTPVYLLANSNVNVRGVISVSGRSHTGNGSIPARGLRGNRNGSQLHGRPRILHL